MQVYIGIYNIAKLQNLYFSRNLQKNELLWVTIFAIHKKRPPITQNEVFIISKMVFVIIQTMCGVF